MAVIKDYLGVKIKTLRLSSGLTQEKLSEMVGINQRQLVRIETGKSYPSFKTLEHICEVFCVEPMDLFDFKEFRNENKADLLKDDILYKIQQIKMYPNKINFINLAINALNKDKQSLLKLHSVIEGMLLAEGISNN